MLALGATVLEVLSHGAVMIVEVGGKSVAAAVGDGHEIEVLVLFGRDGRGQGAGAERADGAGRQAGEYVILESAILFEAGFAGEVDTTLAVLAPVEERVKRCMERDGSTREEVLRRMANQADDDTLHRLADRTIVNVRRDYLESDVQRLHEIYSHEAKR